MSIELTEFESKLKVQGGTVSLVVGRSAWTLMQALGFRKGQGVLIRFGREKMEIRPRDTPWQIVQKLKLHRDELKEMEGQIRAYLGKLPRVSDEELGDLPEGQPEEPLTLETELLATLECLLADDLEPAIRKLETLTRREPDQP